MPTEEVRLDKVIRTAIRWQMGSIYPEAFGHQPDKTFSKLVKPSICKTRDDFNLKGGEMVNSDPALKKFMMKRKL